jgi:hypothetical protein
VRPPPALLGDHLLSAPPGNRPYAFLSSVFILSVSNCSGPYFFPPFQNFHGDGGRGHFIVYSFPLSFIRYLPYILRYSKVRTFRTGTVQSNPLKPFPLFFSIH